MNEVSKLKAKVKAIAKNPIATLVVGFVIGMLVFQFTGAAG